MTTLQTPPELIMDEAREVARFVDDLQRSKGLTDRQIDDMLKLVRFWRANRD